MKKLALIFIPIFLFGCTTEINTDDETSTETPDATEVEDTEEIPEVLALVDELELNIVSQNPLQMEATVKGNFRNGCEEIARRKITHLFQENRFEIKITTKPNEQAEGGACTQALVPFEKTESLPTQGLKAGEYTVDANGITKSFIVE